MTGKAELATRQAGDIAGINKELAQLRIQKTQGIQDLSQQLQSGALSEREFKFKVMEANRNFKLKEKELAAAQYAARTSASKDPTSSQMMAAAFTAKTGDDGFVSPGTWSALKSQWVSGGYGSAKQFDKAFKGYRNPKNPYYTLG